MDNRQFRIILAMIAALAPIMVATALLVDAIRMVGGGCGA